MADPQARRRGRAALLGARLDAGEPLARAGAGRRMLSPRSARTLYNVADAWIPPGAGGGPGGGDVDVAPHVERRLRHQGLPAARRLVTLLAAIEWLPVLTLRSRRPFSQLPRERRGALLASWERSRIPGRRRAVARLRRTLEEAFAAHSSEGA